jgi:hypothetical protein
MGETHDEAVRRSLSTPATLETRIGRLRFVDGTPTPDTSASLLEHLTFTHALNTYLDAFPIASTHALRKGFADLGVEDNDVAIFSELMDSSSLFLTANADTVYFVGIVDLTDGPMVLETPPDALGTIDDMWFEWVTDFGVPGPDRGAGGHYLLVPPNHDGPLPEGGFYVAFSKTNHVLLLGRSFLQDDDPAPTVTVIKDRLRIYPYTPGGLGTSVATLLEGVVPLSAASTSVPETRFVEASGVAVNTIPPSDEHFFHYVHEAIQAEPADAAGPERMGQLDAIGIRKGEPFEPDDRLRAILRDAADVGAATSRALMFDAPASMGIDYYGQDSAWTNMLFPAGYTFDAPPPELTPQGIVPHPSTGARKLDLRTMFFYGYTGITPAMCMRLPGIGSQYLVAFKDADGSFLDGSAEYRVTLPPDIPAARFWSLTAYDNQTRSMLQTPQRFPRAGSQRYPTPAASAADDGSTTIVFAAARPDDIPEGNWVQTDPSKGWLGLPRVWLTSLSRRGASREGCSDAQEVPSGVQA